MSIILSNGLDMLTERNYNQVKTLLPNCKQRGDTVKQTLGELRNKKNLTQRELAKNLSRIDEETRFSSASIALYELGLRTPGLQKAKLLARYFGVHVEDILFGPDACKMQAEQNSNVIN